MPFISFKFERSSKNCCLICEFADGRKGKGSQGVGIAPDTFGRMEGKKERDEGRSA